MYREARATRAAPAVCWSVQDFEPRIGCDGRVGAPDGEAFGSAAESIIEQAVERIEKVAWEVVPRLAETLILEEIRKLKGGDSEEA